MFDDDMVDTHYNINNWICVDEKDIELIECQLVVKKQLSMVAKPKQEESWDNLFE